MRRLLCHSLVLSVIIAAQIKGELYLVVQECDATKANGSITARLKKIILLF